MNEGRITAIFAVIAAIALGLAWWSKPESAVSEKDEMRDKVGQEVFASFEDPETAASMQIIKYDEALAQLKRFEVARDSTTKLWTLPSHDGYPADAAEQVKDATTPLIGLRVLDVVSDLQSDHELYGVVNPDDEQLAAGTSGVGMLVTVKNDADQVLASLVIGKEVEQAEGQRYVRIPTEDVVYKVEIDTNVFTTNFRDWIEGELLGVRSMDINKVAVRDYSLAQSLTQVTLQRNFDAEVQYDSADSQWSLVSMTSYASGAPLPVELGADEELNAEFLNALRTAVQDLEIVDVQRKPTGLAADLKADDSLLKDQESVASLQQQGFFAAQVQDGTEIFAAGGETIIGTEDGVDYLLRFGEATASLSSMDNQDDAGGLSRYLLVTAKLNDDAFPQPELEPVPETVEEMLALERGDSEPPAVTDLAPLENADTGNSTEENAPDVDSQSEATDVEANSTEDADSDSPASDDDATSDDATSDDATSDDATSDDATSDEPQASASGSGDANEAPADSDAIPSADSNTPPSDESNQPEADSQNAQTDAPPATSESTEEPTEEQPPQETEEELKERLDAVREEIAKENQRKIEERNDRIDAARKKVLELNARFSEWYYVVSDSVYGKLKITREDLIQKAGDSAGQQPDFSEGIPGLNGFQFPPQP